MWSKGGKLATDNTIYYCVPVSLTVLGLFRTSQKGMEYFNK